MKIFLLCITITWFQVTAFKTEYDFYKADLSNEDQWIPTIVRGPETIVSKGAFVADGVDNILPHNNNLAAALYQGRLFLAWRTAPFHFASAQTRMYVVSSPDMGVTWEYEAEVAINKDLREPYLLAVNGSLFFFYFEAGTNPIAFEPSRMWRMQRMGQVGQWGEAQQWGHEGEVAWQYNVNNEEGIAYTISYSGQHYSTQLGKVDLFFNQSSDGITWEPYKNEGSKLYTGGISEVGWAFDLNGTVWGIGRNEDGDDSGWGSRVFSINKSSELHWTSTQSDPNIYESPRMFRHGKDLYLVARTDPKGPFMSAGNNILPNSLHHILDLAAYSLRPHGTALWKLDIPSGNLIWIMDLPGCGDTAFPSIVRISDHSFLILNYSSPLKECANWTWIQGQISPAGTLIYGLYLEFVRV